jgi:hypothetical protein
MANRSYLYSSNLIPSKSVAKSEHKLVGLSEWPNGIPLVYRILMSGNPHVCRTSIWDSGDEIALVSDYAAGLDRLKQFFQQINLSQAQPYIDEALQFLQKSENMQPYFVLECGEIYCLTEEPMQEQNIAVLHDIQDLSHETTVVLEDLHILANPASEKLSSLASLAKFFGRKPAEVNQQEQENKLLNAIFQLGLGEWNNLLYFNFSNDAADASA